MFVCSDDELRLFPFVPPPNSRDGCLFWLTNQNVFRRRNLAALARKLGGRVSMNFSQQKSGLVQTGSQKQKS